MKIIRYNPRPRPQKTPFFSLHLERTGGVIAVSPVFDPRAGKWRVYNGYQIDLNDHVWSRRYKCPPLPSGARVWTPCKVTGYYLMTECDPVSATRVKGLIGRYYFAMPLFRREPVTNGALRAAS